MELRLENINHVYGDTQVLDGISLTIPSGQITCLIGPSGCGKSTLLRLAGGLELPTGGDVIQVGDPPSGSLNPLTYVFQDFALLPWRTAADNVSLALEDHPISAKERSEIVAETLTRTGLIEFRDAYPKNLSGGMKQRVAIARALAVRPAVWLMDEPLSALDAQTRELLMDDLVGLWCREPFTAIYVTHNLAEAVRLGHRIAVLSRRPGRVREIVEVRTPLDARGTADPQLEAHQRRLWGLIRDEAQAADRELVNG
ncbi:MAG: ABC transporter ATP-binding protein [Pseudomonadota bacterium]